MICPEARATSIMKAVEDPAFFFCLSCATRPSWECETWRLLWEVGGPGAGQSGKVAEDMQARNAALEARVRELEEALAAAAQRRGEEIEE